MSVNVNTGVYARQPARRAGVDTANCGMRVRTAHESRLKHARKFEIVDETAATSKERLILEPQHSFANCVSLHHVEHVSKQDRSQYLHETAWHSNPVALSFPFQS